MKNKKTSKIIVAIYILITSLGLITLKFSTTAGAPIDFSSGSLIFHINTFTLIGILLYGFSFLLYLYLLSRFSLGYIIPVTTAMVYLLVFTLSFVVFKEVFTIPKIFGIILVLLGFIFLNIKGKTSVPI